MDSIPVWIAAPRGPYTLAEWAEAERHLGPRLARRAWRGARARGHQGSKRPTAQDPDRAFSLPFYLSAGCAAHGPSEHATSSHPYPTCPEPPGGNESPSAAPAPHHTHGLSLGPAHSRKTLALLSALAPLAVGIIPRFTISMSQEEKKHLEAEGKQVRVSAGDR